MTVDSASLRFLRSPEWPSPADFAPAPTTADFERWAEADRAARPQRLARLREQMAAAGVDGYFGLRWEHMRYLTGLPVDESEVTGTAFSPDGSRLYFSSQRGKSGFVAGTDGHTFEVTGPFRR